MKTALTIAGSDSSGGAGIQADLKTMAANGVYGMSAITALTAQNTMGVSGILEVTPDFLEKQLDAVFCDIRPDAVKIGMIPRPELVEVIAERLSFYSAEHIVLDPVMVATSKAELTSSDAVKAMQEQLFGMAIVITPNIPEAEVLWGRRISKKEEMEQAAADICERWGCAVLCKGGHELSSADDVLCEGGTIRWFEGRRIDNPNTHGTGCTLSSAIAANLAKGFALCEAISRAKAFVSGALASQMKLGHGSGPLNHLFAMQSEFHREAENG